MGATTPPNFDASALLAPLLAPLWPGEPHESVVATVREALGGVSAPADQVEAFALHVLGITHEHSSDPASAAPLRLGDLWLAFRAAHRDRAAMETLDAQVLRPALAHLAKGDADAEDAIQRVRMVLFLGTNDAPPRLLAYAGRGDLRKWVRVAATRAWLNGKRSVRREVLDEDEALGEQTTFDPEVAMLKSAYRAVFREAFRSALGELTPRQRTLFRQHYIDGMTMEQMGLLYQVHRLTIFRWIEAARGEISEVTRRLMAEKLTAKDAEVASVLRMIQSQLDFSLRLELGSSSPSNDALK
jgi:RNA polymerase sigma-70 factor (ECF subfamily)